MKIKAKIKHWLKDAAIYLLILIGLSMGVDAWRKQDMQTEAISSINATAMTGEYIDIIEISKEKPVILYFWETWCTACKFVSPTINWFSDHSQVIGVSRGIGER